MSLQPQAQEASAAPRPSGFWERDALTGDWGGMGADLRDHGLTTQAQYAAEFFNIPAGGIHQGSVYEDLIQLTIDADLSKMGRPEGGTVHVKGYRINDGGPSGKLGGNDLDISTIEVAGYRATRLWTLWYQQNAWADRLSVRMGQIAAAEEFMYSPTGANLLNTAFGFNAFSYSHLRPVPTLSSPGVRIQLDPTERASGLIGMFAHRGANPERGGFDFKVNEGGAFVISELQYKINQGKGSEGLAGTYKLGAWYDTGRFNDPYRNTDGNPLPVSGGAPLQHTGDWSLYAMGDQTIWRSTDGRSLTPFLLVGVAPPAFNLVTFYADAGCGYKGALPERPQDTLTFGIGYASVGSAVRKLDIASGLPVRNAEAVLELDYLAQLAGWWTAQPDFQYVIRPNFGSALPRSSPPARIPNATVFGIRTTATF